MATKKRSTSKRKARSLHLGLNAVNPASYSGWSGDLMACEFDAIDMAALAKASGMNPTILLTRQATRSRVLAKIRAAAKALRRGDLLFLTYSGHGGQIPDVTGEEPDKKDETWCLYDGELIDDELYYELSRFVAGVRILVLSDSCHSGTVTRAAVLDQPADAGARGRPRLMPFDVALRTYREHQAFYDNLQRAIAAKAGGAEIDPDTALAHVAASPRLIKLAARAKAAVLLISGCQDNQTSMDGDHNGAFTEQLLAVWNSGAYQGDYTRFHAAIKGRMPSTQTPNLFLLGPAASFVRQRPFAV